MHILQPENYQGYKRKKIKLQKKVMIKNNARMKLNRSSISFTQLIIKTVFN